MTEIMKIVRFQSLNYTSKLKGYLFQTTKLREELVTSTNRQVKKRDEAKQRSKLKMTIFYYLEFSYFLLCYFTSVYISKMEFQLLSISSL